MSNPFERALNTVNAVFFFPIMSSGESVHTVDEQIGKVVAISILAGTLSVETSSGTVVVPSREVAPLDVPLTSRAIKNANRHLE